MVLRAAVLWVIGLVTIVPWATWYLLYRAERDQYALLITLVLFWVFGFWGVVGPILATVKVRRVFATLEKAHAEGRLAQALRSRETAEVAIDFIAEDNHIPRFLAARVYRLLMTRIAASTSPDATRPDHPPR
jgi:hypothetical protein